MAATTGVVGQVAGTRLDRPGGPAGDRRHLRDGDRRRHPDGTPDPDKSTESNAPCLRQGAFFVQAVRGVNPDMSGAS
jgi:hypothetical protein